MDDIRARLKYFYFVDYEKTITEVRNTDSYRAYEKEGNSVNKLFQVVFDKIISDLSPYIEYIVSPEQCYAPPSFWGPVVANHTVMSLFKLCGISIFNHCVLQGYEKSLREVILNDDEYAKFRKKFLYMLSNYSDIKVSANTIESIKRGLVYERENKSPYITKDDHGARVRCNEYYKSFKSRTKQKSPAYMFLNRIRTDILENSDQQQLFQFEKTQCNGALFIYENSNAKEFDKLLMKEGVSFPRLLSCYTQLHKETEEWKKGLLLEDSFLCDNVLERFYKFEEFDYINSLYKEFATNSEQRNASIRGESFDNIVAQVVSGLPMTYNRTIFLKYAIESLKYVEKWEKTYPKKAGTAVAYVSTEKITDYSFAPLAIKSMVSYFNMLLKITIPLIVDLWNVVSEELEIQYKDYKKFLEANNQIICLDFTKIPEDVLKDVSMMEFTKVYEVISEYACENKTKRTLNSGGFSKEHEIDMGRFLKKLCSCYGDVAPVSIVERIARQRWKKPVEYCLEDNEFLENHIRNICSYVDN